MERVKARCLDPDDPQFARHGGVGIGMWPAWQALDGFAAWAAENGAAIGLTLERIDEERDYEPSNCQWAKSRPPLSRAVIRSDGRRFETMSEAARETPGCNSYRISLVCRGAKKSCGGFGWRFETTDQDQS